MSDSPGPVRPQPASTSAALAELHAEDRHEHADVPPVGTPEYRALRGRDRRRREQAVDLLDSLGASGVSAEDLYHAAWLFNHGDQPAEARRAHELAREAAERGHRPARWLAAAAYDRWCMYEGRPQRYGTQFLPDGVRHRLWDIDPATTDEERAAWDVPPLAEQLRRADELTRNDPQPPMDDAPAWLRAAIDRWASEGGEEQTLRRAGRLAADQTMELPFIDQHAVRITASREVAWKALEKYVAALLRRTELGLLTKLLGAVPRAGFEIAERVPPNRLTLVGRHRFARYQLTFDLTEEVNDATRLRATTHAEFPGLRGRVYRALVIGTRAHVFATTHILQSIRRRAMMGGADLPSGRG